MKDLEKFKAFLTKRAVVILDPTNPYEVLRFKTVNGVSVVYTNKNGHLTFTGESEPAHRAFKGGKRWIIKDKKRAALKARKAKLAARDGKMCFFCLAKLGFDKLTIEHLLSVSQGGSDNDNNLALACEPCNKALGNLPIVKKILWRQERLKKAAVEYAKNDFAYFAEKFMGIKLMPKQLELVEAMLEGKQTTIDKRRAGYSTCASVAFEVAKRRGQNV